MATRNALDLYDPALARKQQMLAEPHKYSSGGGSRAPQPVPLSPDLQKKLLDALAKQAAKLREREEERRRRDPTYRPDAIELSNANLLEFDKYEDYYAVLGVDQFASAGELKAAFRQRSLELHPDKQKGKSDSERAAARESFLTMTAAHQILSDLATRRAYDHARDHLDARNESGLLDVGKVDKPPPTCVDVEVTLEQLYRGVRRSVRFTRNEFAGTRWAKTTFDDYIVKINRGEYEGATVWHRSAGDVGPKGRADLVFVVRQTPHELFERLGDDLWYYARETLPSDAIFYVGWAPTIGPTPKSHLKHAIHPEWRQVAVVGHSLNALFGFDRSGLGEAIVTGHGLPLRDGAPDEEPSRDHGDLVVRFPIELPSAPRRIRLAAADGLLPMPPISMIAPQVDSGELPADAARVLIFNSLLPHVLRRVHRDRLAQQRRRDANAMGYPPPLHGDSPLPAALSASAHPPMSPERPPTQLSGVCLLMGGAERCDYARPSMAARGLMDALTRALPDLSWHTVRMSSYVAEPLLIDEMIEIEHATFLIVEALTDESPHARPHAAAAASPAAAAVVDVSEGAAAAASEFGAWAGVTEWHVDFAPGVRVRSRPSSSGVPCGIVRAAQRLRGSLVTEESSLWIQLADGRFVQCVTPAGQVLIRPADERAVGKQKETEKGEVRAAVRAADERDESEEEVRAVSEREKLERAAEQCEIDEDAAWAADVASRQDVAVDETYLESGCSWACALMLHPSAACVSRCHGNGGLLLAVGSGCAVFGHPGRRQYGRLWAGGDEGATVRLSLDELLEIRADAMADDIEVNPAKMCTWSAAQAQAYFENNGVMPARWSGGSRVRRASEGSTQGAAGLLLPYLISAAPAARSAADVDGWRGLRAATLRAKPDESAVLGYSAIGLSHGCVVSVLTANRHAVRAVLGSAAPCKLSLRKLREADDRRVERSRRRRVEAARMLVLDDMRRSVLQMHGCDTDELIREQQALIDKAAKAGGSLTRLGEFRGVCTACVACTGYTRALHLGLGSQHWHACACCGCDSREHEEKREGETNGIG